MAPGISYDDSGSLASYFGVTILALILLPTTYVALKPSKKGIVITRHHSLTIASLKPLTPLPKGIRQTHPKAKSSSSSSAKTRRIVLLSLGWALLAFLCYKVANAPSVAGEVVYNPFEILGISDKSTDKQIKKHYKKLSLQLQVPSSLHSSELIQVTPIRSSWRRIKLRKRSNLNSSISLKLTRH